MDREPFKMTDAGSRPEPRRFPVRLVVAIYLVACVAILVGVLLYAASRRPAEVPENENGKYPPPPSSGRETSGTISQPRRGVIV